MLPLRRSKFFGICQTDPAVSLISIRLQQAPAILFIYDGVHTDRDVAVRLVGSRGTFAVVQVINGYLHKIRLKGLCYSRIHLIPVIIKGGITGIGIHAVPGVLEYRKCADLAGLLRPALTDTIILCGHWRRRYRSCRSRLTVKLAGTSYLDTQPLNIDVV